jgi:hypothetical protein
MRDTHLHDFATRYTAAWCSQDAASVALFFCAAGSLTINAGTPSVGRSAITAAAQSFMCAFPDLLVTMDRLFAEGEQITYHWTLTGAHTGAAGTDKSVRISGCEQWRFGSDGLIAESHGYFDAADYQRNDGRCCGPRRSRRELANLHLR